MADVNVTWLGDEDPSVQSIQQYGHTFVKGRPTSVPEKDANMGKFKDNAYFSVGKDKAEVVESKEPEPVDPDAGTEKDALRRALTAAHQKWDGRESEETLRNRLAAFEARQAGHE